MRILPVLLAILLLFPTPMQEAEVSVNVLAGLSLSDHSVEPNEPIVLALFINITIEYNGTPIESYNGSIEIEASIKIPEGINVTSLSVGNFTNSTIEASRYNKTSVTLYASLVPRKEGSYRLSAVVNVTPTIYINEGNDTVFYNKTTTVTSNFVTLKVSHEEPQSVEERNRLGIKESLRLRYFQLLLVLVLVGFLLSNAISDLRAKRKK